MSRQFDVHRNAFAKGRGDPPFIVNLQADLLAEYPTVVVAPLWPDDRPGLVVGLTVQIDLPAGRHVVSIAELVHIRRSSLGRLSLAPTICATRSFARSIFF